jgi:hypothetical protein
MPATVAAHGLDVSFVSPLPLAAYLAGAALAVGLSFVFVLFRDVRPARTPPAPPAIPVPAWLRLGLRAVGLVGWLWIVAQAIVGGISSADVASLFLWVYGWVGLALLSALVGPIWHWLDPFATLHDIGIHVLRRLGVEGRPPAPYPRALGAWPAVAGFVFFVWVELVLGLGSGQALGLVMIGYTAVTLAGMAQYGRDTWRRNAETFSVWFDTLGRLAPFALADEEGTTVQRRPFATALISAPWPHERVVLVALGAAAVLYDGLSQTEPWYRAFGLPDLAGGTLLLAAFLGIVALAVTVASRTVGLPALGAGLLPIAIGYMAAHYLSFLIVDGQRLVIAISDPFQQGWDVFGTAFYQPGAAWLTPGMVWTVQLCAVVGAHVLGAWAGHLAALNVTGRASQVDLRLRQLPLAAVMVALTTTTLWSLGQAVVATAPPG